MCFDGLLMRLRRMHRRDAREAPAVPDVEAAAAPASEPSSPVSTHSLELIAQHNECETTKYYLEQAIYYMCKAVEDVKKDELAEAVEAYQLGHICVRTYERFAANLPPEEDGRYSKMLKRFSDYQEQFFSAMNRRHPDVILPRSMGMVLAS